MFLKNKKCTVVNLYILILIVVKTNKIGDNVDEIKYNK